MRIYLLTLALLLFPNFAVSEERLSLPLQTRFGTLEQGAEVGCNQAGDICINYSTIMFQGERLWSGGQVALPDILHLIEWGTEKDFLLLKLSSGGASCCTSYRFLILGTDGAHYSEEFGDHGYDPKEFNVSKNQISFRLERDYPANIDHLRVMFDGESVAIKTVFEDDTGTEIAGKGRDVSRWLGARPFLFWEDGTERNRFRQIMTDAVLNCLRASTSRMGSDFELKDGYLISSGMWPHQGGSRHGYVAIEVETGQPFAVQKWNDELHYFGATHEAFPQALQNWIEPDVSRLDTAHKKFFGNRAFGPSYAESCS